MKYGILGTNDMSVNSTRLLSDRTLRETRERLRSESREQCCFCVLFTGAAAGSIVVVSSSHGATIPADIPAITIRMHPQAPGHDGN